MSLEGKLVSEIKIKCDGNVFHEIYMERPYHISSMSPNRIRNVDILEGEWGSVGSVVAWDFFHVASLVSSFISGEEGEKKRDVRPICEGSSILGVHQRHFSKTVAVGAQGEREMEGLLVALVSWC
ncbi:hypothetical protein HAX54_041518 [Datura stramonium]|uniref:Bet v I/Major latex protein domain-containing protein n=1 Tax=Datura stramonium TaxID=4076 RepID=A0ABS8RGY7_DATST|nr:hypothetical protein [Datura stramonium]